MHCPGAGHPDRRTGTDAVQGATAAAGAGRAVLGHPTVLGLADPLSALNVHTKAEVEVALRRVLHSVTAHRPSTVQLADRVALLDGGRIAAVGTHSELLAEVPEYAGCCPQMDDAMAAR